ncbi:hypothetical protein [uncultured Deefgea sp.]|uniref:hypothetical protein n=1 Tax=uncultured Deefgea sp. TaxID=1304914 RepID=UPI00260C9BA1|nr:hypothetical protein [uncultured Deefgea sp.]
MWIKLNCSFTDKNGAYAPGDIVDAAAADAKQLLELELAEKASKPSEKLIEDQSLDKTGGGGSEQ